MRLNVRMDHIEEIRRLWEQDRAKIERALGFPSPQMTECHFGWDSLRDTFYFDFDCTQKRKADFEDYVKPWFESIVSQIGDAEARLVALLQEPRQGSKLSPNGSGATLEPC